jgi:hypothetical protein
VPVSVKAVPGRPYGRQPRVCLRIESGYRAGSLVVHPGENEQPIHWISRAAAEAWARDTGYTVVPADPSVDSASVMLLVNLFETFSDFQFEHRSINGADLVDSLGQWLRQHSLAVSRLVASEPDAAAVVLEDLFRTFRAVHGSNEDVNGGDLVDAFGEWLAAVAPRMPELTGGRFVANVARSREGAYWSERLGWGELEDATAYFRTVPGRLASAEPAGWIEVELAAEELAQAERWVAVDTIRG